MMIVLSVELSESFVVSIKNEDQRRWCLEKLKELGKISSKPNRSQSIIPEDVIIWMETEDRTNYSMF